MVSHNTIEKFKQSKIDLGCSLCKYNKCADALHFHHLDRSKPRYNISAKNFRSKRAKSELENKKQILLCCNCHYELHLRDGMHRLMEKTL